jgi:hypothetical protein
MSAGLRCINLTLMRSAFLARSFKYSSGSNVDPGKGMKQPKNIQDPQNHRNNHDAVQNGLDGSLHGNETIHQPQEDTHHDQNFQQLN